MASWRGKGERERERGERIEWLVGLVEGEREMERENEWVSCAVSDE